MKNLLSIQAIRFGVRSFFTHFKMLMLSELVVAGPLVLLVLISMIWIPYIFLIKIFGIEILARIASIATIWWGEVFAITATAIKFAALEWEGNMVHHIGLVWMHIVAFFLFFVGIFLFYIVKTWFTIVFQKFALDVYDKKPIKIRTSFSRFSVFIKMLFANMIYLLIVVFGVIGWLIVFGLSNQSRIISALLSTPYIFWAARFSLFPYFIIDKGAGVIDSFRSSYRMVKRGSWDIFLLFFIFWIIVEPFGLMSFIFGPGRGLLLFVSLPTKYVDLIWPFFRIGFFIVSPILPLIYAYIYRRLASSSRQIKS